MSCVESLVSVSFPLVICAFLFVRLIDWFLLSPVGREGKGREGEYRVVWEMCSMIRWG